MLEKTCSRCSAEIELGRRLTGKSVCANCQEELDAEEAQSLKELEERRESQRTEYLDALAPLYEGAMATINAFQDLRELEPGPDLDQEEVEIMNRDAINALAKQAFADQRLGVWEEVAITATCNLFGVRKGGWAPGFENLGAMIAIGAANDGRLFPGSMPAGVPSRRDESRHLEIAAVRLDEVKVRELVLNQNALSFEFRDGIAYQHGKITGTEREVSQGIQEIDRGQLLITSQRVLFVGRQASEEIDLNRLLGVQVLGEVVELRISGRKRYPTFRFGSALWAHAVAAMANAAAQVANGRALPTTMQQIPEMPQASEEFEELLARGQSAGRPEWQARFGRMMFALGHVDATYLAAMREEVQRLETAAPKPKSHPAFALPVADDRDNPTTDLLGSLPSGKDSPVSVSGDDFELEITDLALISEAQLPQGMQMQGELGVLRFRIKNTSKAAIDFYGRRLVLKDRDGTSYEAWTGGAEDTYGLRKSVSDLMRNEMIQPKLWVSGSVAFDLPPEADLAAVEVPQNIATLFGAPTIEIELPENLPRTL